MSDLSDHLKSFTSQVSGIDNFDPASRGTCAVCHKPILNAVVNAGGRSYHVEHFACAHCNTPLKTGTYFEKDGAPFCPSCWDSSVCERCVKCSQPINDKIVHALGGAFHDSCFTCGECGTALASREFFDRHGTPVCTSH
eukprot:TRINITY_DN442_c0_g1_i1.p1 TRINITY_DN442_c0_g1~~TRINITY_DN442_c0_g1_i1.p1  ORF type:complete len:139 (+),score=22.55 TRINITY_DN442_c0_g1_i1:149-565(+)